MRTRTLGPLEVSVVGLGCNNFGRRIDADATRAVVDAALEVGVSFFDTADVYGNRGGSETILGEVLQGRRDQVVLATKWGAMLDFDEQPHGTRGFVRSAIDASRSFSSASASGRSPPLASHCSLTPTAAASRRTTWRDGARAPDSILDM